jgi:hypothetical protein
MSNKIKVQFMTDEAIETIRNNSVTVFNKLKENSLDSSWLKDIYSENPFKEKEYEIESFVLDFEQSGDYAKVDFANSIKLFENLKHLPRYILTDERFWAWINFTVGYKAARQAIPLKDKPTAFTDHWLFNSGNRRGIFFGVLSRCFFRVELSHDEKNSDPYHLSRFVIENVERFRNLTWRANSSQKKIVMGALKAEKMIEQEYKGKVANDIYPKVAIFIAKLGSVKLLDIFTEEEIYNEVYKFMKAKLTSE